MKPESIIEHMHHDLDSDMKAVDRTYKAAVDTMITLPQKEAVKALYDAAQAMHINCTQNIDMLREAVKDQELRQLKNESRVAALEGYALSARTILENDMEYGDDDECKSVPVRWLRGLLEKASPKGNNDGV